MQSGKKRRKIDKTNSKSKEKIAETAGVIFWLPFIEIFSRYDVCIYVYMYVCMYVHMYVFMYICMYVCMYIVRIYVCMYECMYV